MTRAASRRRVLAVVPDLLLFTRVAETAKQLGAQLVAVELERAPAAARQPGVSLLVLDLEAPGNPVALIRALKSDPASHGVEIVCFYPHVRGELRRAALEAGADRVVPRSAFTARLAELLAGERGTAT